MDFGDHFFLEWIVFYKSVIRPTNTVTNATPMDASASNDADLPFSSIPRYSIADQWNPRIDTTLSIRSTFFSRNVSNTLGNCCSRESMFKHSQNNNQIINTVSAKFIQLGMCIL